MSRQSRIRGRERQAPTDRVSEGKSVGANPAPLDRGLMRKTARTDAVVVSAARHAYGLPRLPVADERRWRTEVPLTLLGIALSAVALWSVLLPAIREKPPSLQSCEVVVLGNGTIRCADGAPLGNAVSKPKS